MIEIGKELSELLVLIVTMAAVVLVFYIHNKE